ncbi:MarR family winged helix-turn-helix transcriptional regulator [Amycolatopsis sp. YIM 10]|uniref:MarR family winged helix-turn-helix transcriptional regulator n=1 Tax=Amycolatopsis sp. YIM 10 TaxID=2653857 RepID=UPI00128FF27B|nr:MarR family transcriptional regulator [Amycolatopsis sp. YIM 10]QFU86975.1 Organic hydroperoxide resistance transcriptional regulator [Amycolatopsis sp. YIM 10]
MDSAPQAETPAVSDLLCFDLYATSRAITGFYRPILDQAGITYPQFLVLLLLWERDSRPIRELVGELGLEYNTLSPLVKRLEKAGLLTRVTHPDDDRSVLVQLTDAGRDLRWLGNEMTCRLGEALDMDEEEITALRRILRKVRHNVH